MTLEHVQSSGGGAWGGYTVDDKFLTMLTELIGPELFKENLEKITEWDLRMEFENLKREVGATMS